MEIFITNRPGTERYQSSSPSQAVAVRTSGAASRSPFKPFVRFGSSLDHEPISISSLISVAGIAYEKCMLTRRYTVGAAGHAGSIQSCRHSDAVCIHNATSGSRARSPRSFRANEPGVRSCAGAARPGLPQGTQILRRFDPWQATQHLRRLPSGRSRTLVQPTSGTGSSWFVSAPTRSL